MKSESAGGSRCIMMIVDDFSHFKVSIPEDELFGRNGDCARDLYRDTPEQVSIRAVRTGHGGKFEREFQLKLITGHTAPAHAALHAQVQRCCQTMDRAVEKTIALLGDLEKLAAGLRKEKYLAEAWNYSKT